MNILNIWFWMGHTNLAFWILLSLIGHSVSLGDDETKLSSNNNDEDKLLDTARTDFHFRINLKNKQQQVACQVTKNGHNGKYVRNNDPVNREKKVIGSWSNTPVKTLGEDELIFVEPGQQLDGSYNRIIKNGVKKDTGIKGGVVHKRTRQSEATDNSQSKPEQTVKDKKETPPENSSTRRNVLPASIIKILSTEPIENNNEAQKSEVVKDMPIVQVRRRKTMTPEAKAEEKTEVLTQEQLKIILKMIAEGEFTLEEEGSPNSSGTEFSTLLRQLIDEDTPPNTPEADKDTKNSTAVAAVAAVAAVVDAVEPEVYYAYEVHGSAFEFEPMVPNQRLADTAAYSAETWPRNMDKGIVGPAPYAPSYKPFESVNVPYRWFSTRSVPSARYE